MAAPMHAHEVARLFIAQVLVAVRVVQVEPARIQKVEGDKPCLIGFHQPYPSSSPFHTMLSRSVERNDVIFE